MYEMKLERNDGSIRKAEIGIRTCRGSSRIENLFIDGEEYLLKMPDFPKIAETTDTSPSSEYMGCEILKSLGLDAQETELVMFDDYWYLSSGGLEERRAAGCLCRYMGKVVRLDLNLRNALWRDKVDYPRFAYLDDYARFLQSYGFDLTDDEFRKFYCRLFIADALIGNPNRNNSNIGINVDDPFRPFLSPVFSCRSAFFPKESDAWYEERISDPELMLSTVMSLQSAVCLTGRTRINYAEFLQSNDCPKEVISALKDMVPRIDLNTIENIIKNTPFTTDTKKEFSWNMVNMMYSRVFLPALNI